ncbi:MAG: YfhO family protein [Flavobacteriales bacterium]
MKLYPSILEGKRIPPFLLFLLLAALVHWPITFFVFSLQYDVMDVLLPWRFFGSEALQEGILPLWNPYQQCGYPFYGDLQYPIWYPEFFFIGSFVRYSPLTLHLLFILYVTIAGLGMYKLGRTIRLSRSFSILAGCCFMFSGLMTGHAQSMVTILGLTWLPWVLTYFLRSLKDPFQLRPWLLLLLSSFLMVTGGYQAISFMLFYLLLVLLLFYVFRGVRQRDHKWLSFVILGNTGVLGGLIILCAGMFLSLYQVFPYLDRLGGLSLEASQQFIFYPGDLFSLLMPHASIKDVHESTGLSMTNLFFSTMLLGGSALAFFKRLPSFLYILAGISLLYLLASFGPYTPVQSFLYHYVPLMDQFKYPVFYRSFFVIAAILLGSWYFDKEKTERSKRFSSWAGGILLLFYLGSALWAYSQIDQASFSYFNEKFTWIESLRESSLYESILFQSALQTILYACFLSFLFLTHLSLRKMIMGLVLTELVLVTALNAPVTVYGPVDPIEMHQVVERYPQGFPTSELRPLKANADTSYQLPNLWRNLGNYSDRPSYSAFTSFHLAHQERLKQKHSKVRYNLFKNPVAYLSPKLKGERHLKKSQQQIDRKALYVSEKILHAHDTSAMAADKEDTLYCTSFRPNTFRFKVRTENPQFLVLLQSWFPGWEVRVDGRKEQPLKVNKAFMAVPLKSGSHTVSFRFSRPWVSALFYISMLGFFALFVACLILSHPAYKKYFLGGMSIFLLVFCLKQWEVHTKADRNELERRIKRTKGKAPLHYVHCDRPKRTISAFPDRLEQGMVFGSVNPRRLSSIARELKREQPDELLYSRSAVKASPELLGTLAYFFGSASFGVHEPERSYVRFGKGNGNTILKWPLERTGSPGWISVDSVESSTPQELSKVHHISPSTEFGSTFEIHGNELPEGNERILTCGGWVRGDRMNKVFLQYEVRREPYMNRQEGIELGKFIEGRDEWSYIQFATYLPTRMDENDRVRVYLWNPEENSIDHKGLTVRIITPGRSE